MALAQALFQCLAFLILNKALNDKDEGMESGVGRGGLSGNGVGWVGNGGMGSDGWLGMGG